MLQVNILKVAKKKIYNGTNFHKFNFKLLIFFLSYLFILIN